MRSYLEGLLIGFCLVSCVAIGWIARSVLLLAN
jgi:hypothetical protein